MKRLFCIVFIAAIFVAGGVLAYISFAGGQRWTAVRDRTLAEIDFAFLERGMSLEEIVAVVGAPSGATDSEQPRPYYELENGILILSFSFSASFPERLDSEDLARIIIRHPDGSEQLFFAVGRTLAEADFDFLERGMSLEEVIAVVGVPSGTFGSGFIRPYYELENGTITLLFGDQVGFPVQFNSENLDSIIIESSDGNMRRIDFEPEMTRVLNVDAEYREITRSLTRNDFRDLRLGGSLTEVREKIGAQNGWIGSGERYPAPFYRLGEGEYAILRFRNPRSRMLLERIEIVNDTEVLEEIILAGELRLVTINNVEHEYVGIERSLTRDDFRGFRRYALRAEIEEKLGAPNSWIGPSLFYILEDGEFAWLLFTGTSGPKYLQVLEIVSESEVLETILGW